MLPPDRNRFLAGPAQFFVLILLLGPLTGLILGSIAPGAAGATLRARAFGLAVDTMVVPTIALFMGVFIAWYYQQRGFQWFYTAMAAVLGLVIVVSVPLYALDVLELRQRVPAEFRSFYLANVMRNFLVMIAYGAALVWLAVKSWKALRGAHEESARLEPALVGTTGAARRGATPQ